MNAQHDPAGTIVRQWIQKAEEDLRTATYLLTMEEDCPYSIVGYHAQQCVGKYIKALLVYHDIDFPKVHDLGKLVQLVPSDKEIPLSVEEQDKLTDYATASRYPGASEPLSRNEAEEAVALAHKVRTTLRSYLPAQYLQS